MRFKSQEQLEQWMAKARKLPAKASVQTPEQQAKTVDPMIQRRILGVDTALRCTGWGIIDVLGNKMKAVDCGVIKNPDKTPVSECLRCLAGGIKELVQLYHPNTAAIEGAFYFQYVRTALMLGSARGAVIANLAENGIEIYEYAPRSIKQSICCFGNASKEQVALLVSQFLNIQVNQIALDSTDALAMAICHAQCIMTSGGLGLPSPL